MANDHYEDADVYMIRADETRVPPTAILPLKPFLAHRVIRADNDRLSPVDVVGMRYDQATKLWQFVCICESDEEIMIDEYDEVVGDLPYSEKHDIDDDCVDPFCTLRQETDRFVIDFDYGGDGNCSYWETYEEAKAEADHLIATGAATHVNDFVAAKRSPSLHVI